MTAVQALLNPEKFVRVHRSHIVNLDYLLEIEPLGSGDARLKLRDGTLVGCSRTYRDALRASVSSP
jgi:DNA-binding LytR/AlgR family response regulator